MSSILETNLEIKLLHVVSLELEQSINKANGEITCSSTEIEPHPKPAKRVASTPKFSILKTMHVYRSTRYRIHNEWTLKKMTKD